MNKKVSVVFISNKLENEFNLLDKELELKRHIFRAIEDIKRNPLSGLKIPQKLWPEEYLKKYNITNLWKYDLPRGWRLRYTLINQSQIEILSVILEWFDHKNYERRFGY
jgi:Txe/YoeB family toxin of Txe-Axe toxin-antitoxin module